MTPVEELFQLLWDTPQDKLTWFAIKKRMLEKEEEFITNFAMDYVFSGEVGCAIYADGPPELDIEKSARDYYKYIKTTSLNNG